MAAVTPTSAVLRGSILADFKRLALALGLDPIALMKRVGIDRRYIEDPELAVPMHAIVDLFESAARMSGVEDFSLRLCQARGVPDVGPVILMLREEATVRNALRTLVAFLHLHSDGVYTHLEEGGDPIFTINIVGGGTGNCRQAIECAVAGLIQILRWLLGQDWAPASVCFAHARPVSRAPYDRFFRCPIQFMHEFNGAVLRRHDLDRKLPASSPALRRQVERYVRMINVGPSDTYAHRVTQVVAMALPRGEARADTVARYLGTTRRTLNQHLAGAGLNYSAVVENVRRSLVVQHLLGSDRPLSDIAGLIGFDSLRAFTRWFGQSFECAPSKWRKSHRQA
jgi:AraC-like DNA-binding protein